MQFEGSYEGFIGLFQAFEGLDWEQGRVLSGPDPHSERPKAGDQVAAIHSRYITGFERLQCEQVVPVVEMTTEALQLIQRLERATQPVENAIP